MPIQQDAEAASILDDDGTFIELLFLRPELVAEDFLVVGEIPRAADEMSSGRIVIGWRRAEGPVLLGATTGSGSEALLIETIGVAATTTGWTLAEWNEAVRRYWLAAHSEICMRMARRWGLAPDAPWSVASWTRAGWGREPIEGEAAVGLVATRIPEPVRAAIAWLARRQPITAFRVRWYGEDATPSPRVEWIAGSWDAVDPGEVPEPPEAPASLDVPAHLLSMIEACCTEVGSEVTRRGSEWVRFDGDHRSLRVFPGPAWVDLQFVGIDEATRIGLSYRYGVRLGVEPPPGAPPGVHLRLVGPELDPRVAALLRVWLASGISGPGSETVSRAPAEAAPEGSLADEELAARPKRKPRSRKPSDSGRRRKPR